MMAAYAAASSDRQARIAIIEKMPRPGRKIMITGKGRCNYTNLKDWEGFSAHIRAGRQFLKPAFFSLTPQKLMEIFEAHGLASEVQRGDRVFPASLRASDVVDCLQMMATGHGTMFIHGTPASGVQRIQDGFSVTLCDGAAVQSRRLIVSTGGLSYPSTGSTGDGYAIAREFGHRLIPTFPSLTALVPAGYKTASGDTPGSGKYHIHRDAPLSALGKCLCGIQLKNVSATLFNGKDAVSSLTGDIDFTDGGMEGPLGFALSRDCVKGLLNGGRMSIGIDLKPGISQEELSARIEQFRCEGQEPLAKLLPGRIKDAFRTSSPDLFKPGRRPQAEALAVRLKNWNFTIAGHVGYERCVVTAGGVDTAEVFPKTMESRLVKGLYFCGEVLDIDADTGGYNLHCAFATGYLAGRSAALSIPPTC